MDEEVWVVFWGDEVEVFGVVELFYGVLLMIRYVLIFEIKVEIIVVVGYWS